MFSVIICNIDPTKFARAEKHFQQLFGNHPYELIGIHDARSICEGYNRGFARAKGESLIFCHDDIEFISPDGWLERLKNHLANFDVVGLAGTTKLIGAGWSSAGPPHMFGQVAHESVTVSGKEMYRLEIFSTPAAAVSEIQALDGMFIAARRQVLDRVKFDEVTFTGFHGYDVDFTFSAHLSGFRLAVACDLPVIHRSTGRLNADWDSSAEKFYRKHASRLAPGKKGRFVVTVATIDTREELLQAMRPPHIFR